MSNASYLSRVHGSVFNFVALSVADLGFGEMWANKIVPIYLCFYQIFIKENTHI